MTVSGVLLVTAVVWAVSLIRSVRLRAFVYSLPLPMTLALVSTGHRVEGAQLLGVLGLNLFFVVVAVTHHRLRWPILLADAAGIAGYVAFSAGLLAVPVPFGPALAGTVALWLVAMLLLRRHTADPTPPAPTTDPTPAPTTDPPPTTDPTPETGPPPGDEPEAEAEPQVEAGSRRRLPAPVKLLVILVGATLTGLLGELLRAMVVTFPYSGVLVAVESRRDLVAFTRHFARNSLALVGFLAAYHRWQDGSPVAALAAGWVAFALVAGALQVATHVGAVRRRAGAVAAAG
ncbi:hypothetical protein DKT68_23975 [Micromonospora acroterricola]|uniref:Uncharacterized protein n=1 Tax=Micromonospora acroterricola TaxID=2202421 RepID=A0A317D0B4_9ACTN|nr:hypothetical protein [Micromonospora acroterricola]PWR06005.1 hypothetical protein DKT68_23975 [Micromonospora acroterricola]